MTVGVIGYGEIGTRVVKLLKPFGCRILVCRPLCPARRAEDLADGVEHVDLDTLLAESDVVTLHARVTDETTRLHRRAPQFARMKQGAYFINTARGPLVDYDALYEALASRPSARRHAGDLLQSSRRRRTGRCCKLPNVTLTPHIAGASTAHRAHRRRAWSPRRCAASWPASRRSTHADPSRKRSHEQGRTASCAEAIIAEVPVDELLGPQPGHLGQHQRRATATAC